MRGKRLFTGKKKGVFGLGGAQALYITKEGTIDREDNYSPDIHYSAQQSNTCLFVVFVPTFDKIVKTELPFNKEPALPLCSSKNQHFTREAKKKTHTK